MTNATPKTSRFGADETVVIDARYLREQANLALKLFAAPLSTVYDAAFGPIATPQEPDTEKTAKKRG